MTTHHIIDLSKAMSKEEVLEILASELSFPDFWGRNWDACWDCMTDPQLSDLPPKLHLSGLAQLRETLPDDVKILSQLLDDLSAERTEISVTWD